MFELIHTSRKEHLGLAQHMEVMDETLPMAGKRLMPTVLSSGCAFIYGDGGSAANKQLFAAEPTDRFEQEQRTRSALALSTEKDIGRGELSTTSPV